MIQIVLLNYMHTRYSEQSQKKQTRACFLLFHYFFLHLYLITTLKANRYNPIHLIRMCDIF